MNIITPHVPKAVVGLKNRVAHRIPTCMRNQITPLRALGAAAGVLLVITTLVRAWMNHQRDLAAINQTAKRQDYTKGYSVVTKESDILLGLPEVEGVVHINTDSGGPLGTDTLFQFKKRITKEDGSPWDIPADDILIELDGEFARGGQGLRKNARGCSVSSLYLPSCLFKGIEEGGKVQFRFDGKLVKLVAKQESHKLFSEDDTFQFTLDEVKGLITKAACPACFVQDIPESYKIAQKLGPFNTRLARLQMQHPDQHETPSESMQKLQAYAEDEAQGPKYLDMPIFDTDSDSTLFEVGQKVAFEDIHIVEFPHQLFVVIPHRLEYNQAPNGADKFLAYDDQSQALAEFDNATFCPNKNRRPLYQWGRFTVLQRRPQDKFIISRTECNNYLVIQRYEENRD